MLEYRLLKGVTVHVPGVPITTALNWCRVQGYYSRMAINIKLKACVNFVDLSDEFSRFAGANSSTQGTPQADWGSSPRGGAIFDLPDGEERKIFFRYVIVDKQTGRCESHLQAGSFHGKDI